MDSTSLLTILLAIILFSILLSGFFDQLTIYTQYSFKNDEASYPASIETVKSAFAQGYAQNTENIFFMVKETADFAPNTSAHLKTTLTRVPNFSVYTEGFVSVHNLNYQSIDLLVNQSEVLKCSKISPEEIYIPTMLEHAFGTAPSSVDWFILMDSSHKYIFVESLAKYLTTLDPSQPLFLGTLTGGVLSRAAIKQSLGKSSNQYNNYDDNLEVEPRGTCRGNLAVLEKLQEIKNTQKIGLESGFQEMTMNKDVGSGPKTWCTPVYIVGHQTSTEIKALWALENSVKENFVCGSHIYNAFVANHIATRISAWDNFAGDIVLSQKNYYRALVDPQFSKYFRARLKRNAFPMDDAQSPTGFVELVEEQSLESMSVGLARPWSNEIQCKNACDRWARCYSWRYLPQSQTYGLGTSVRLGEAVSELSDASTKLQTIEGGLFKLNDVIVSGYQMERIEASLKNLKCDSTI
ncbi:uncharacterized protein SAPINGB_P002080 [Magnusiomyces paraingens]|uniref:Uncharacterized protein n=1 Tax=Magnusiomyces paraingens TaxID=2606893 RepID=A0A5E8BK26_9ASCO|nr:uncharacterized protein SAPINGB_P002080 [Saprochaete ingens]VVT49051.1 unnamed protein product [Saprochaete ingens]